MATTGTNSAATAIRASALTPEVRRKLKTTVLELRHILEDDFRRQLAAVAVTEEGAKPLAAGRVLSDEQQRVRDTAIAMLKREVAGDASQAEAYSILLRESVFTFLNRTIGLRCLEARGILLVDGQTETVITQVEELGGSSSLYWRVRNMPGGPTQPRDIWRESYRRACVAVSQDIRVLFDPDAEYAALFPLLPTMHRVVEALNDAMIPAAAYTEDAVLGWVYQYFQSEDKDRIFAEVRSKKKKIAGADIIPVTQLYTEQYMVDFLLQNSLGRTWMEMYPNSTAKAAWPYYVESAAPHSRLHRPLRDWTVLDPCVGSGHFLVVAFDLFMQLYTEERRMGEQGMVSLEETVAPEDVPLTILERNLYGIDIDRRATQIATLALYLKAREAGLSRSPRVNIVAADTSYLQGEAWDRFLAGFQKEPSVRRVLMAMAGYLKDIRELGSLLSPEKELKRLIAEEHRMWEEAGRPQQAELFADYEQPRQERLAFEQVSDATFWEHLSYRAEAAIQAFYDSARASGDLDEQIVAGEAQRGFAFLELCQRRYDVVCTNPPFMGSKNMGKTLKDFASKHFAAGRRDLCTAFILRCKEATISDGYVAMVTMNKWMFLQAYEDLRVSKAGDSGLLESGTLEVIADLGSKAFDLGNKLHDGVQICIFILRNERQAIGQDFVAIRMIAPVGPHEKGAGLVQAVLYRDGAHLFQANQQLLRNLPMGILAFWLPADLAQSLSRMDTLKKIAEPRAGFMTGDSPRFIRAFWEIKDLTCWLPLAHGGGYGRWHGFENQYLRWDTDSQRILEQVGNKLPSREYYGRPGLSLTQMASGSLGARIMDGAAFTNSSVAVFARPGVDRAEVAAILNSHTSSFYIRVISQKLGFEPKHLTFLPICRLGASFIRASHWCIDSKYWLDQYAPLERVFRDCEIFSQTQPSEIRSVQAILHASEGWIEVAIARGLGIDAAFTNVLQDTGTPAGWHPLLAGYDALPALPDGLPPVPPELTDYLAQHQRLALSSGELARIKARLRTFYVAGAGAKVEGEAAEDNSKSGRNGNGEGEEGEEEEEATVTLDARIPIPAETFLEELSQKLEVHPISIYWLLEEMRREEDLVCPPELRRQVEDYASVSLLRILGFRWPEQDTYEAEHGPILDPALVVEDGILSLVDCGTGVTAAQLIRLRLECDLGEEGAGKSEDEFRRWVGRPLEDWLRRDFFKRHIQQFKQRPIAWHFVSPQKTFEAFVLYQRLCDESSGRETLRSLRTQYAGGLITRLRGEQDRARSARDESEVTRLQRDIEDVEEFRERLEQIERGDNLKARIRCRWQGDEARSGRPGPYAPDINDGVKVNVRPFQELGLLATPVIKEWD